MSEQIQNQIDPWDEFEKFCDEFVARNHWAIEADALHYDLARVCYGCDLARECTAPCDAWRLHQIREDRDSWRFRARGMQRRLNHVLDVVRRYVELYDQLPYEARAVRTAALRDLRALVEVNQC